MKSIVVLFCSIGLFFGCAQERDQAVTTETTLTTASAADVLAGLENPTLTVVDQAGEQVAQVPSKCQIGQYTCPAPSGPPFRFYSYAEQETKYQQCDTACLRPCFLRCAKR